MLRIAAGYDASAADPCQRRTPTRIEVLDPLEAMTHRDAWLDLQTRCLEPNPFLDPDFLLAATQHLGAARRPKVLLVWDAKPLPRRLVAVHALARSRVAWRALVQPWTHALVPHGVPLIDRERGAEAAGALLGWVAAVGGVGILFTNMPAEGPAMAVLARAARDHGFPITSFATWRRAVLKRETAGGADGHAALSPKGAKEARRQRRRLAERGTLAYVSARSDGDLREAAEHFLTLEALGWKGAAGTALLMQPGQTVFTRAMTRLLVPRGRCRIDGLMLDGAPMAMGVVLTHGDTDFLWKIAYDERFARYSPGVQFIIEFTERQRREGRAAVTDSCAVPDHPMIDRIWRDRLDLADIAIGTGAGFEVAAGRQRLYRRLREGAKRLRAAWRSR